MLTIRLNSIVILISLVFLLSCNLEKTSEKKVNNENDSVSALDSTGINKREADSEITYSEENNKADIVTSEHIQIENPFERLKASYEQLSYSEGRDPYVYHYCEAEVPSVVVDTDEDGFKRFIIALGQDSQLYKILSISGETYEKELYQVAEYVLEVEDIYDQSHYTVSALINEDDGTSFFEGIDYLHNVYIREDFSPNVDHDYENCDYLNDY